MSDLACPDCSGSVGVHHGKKRWQCLTLGCGAGGHIYDGRAVVTERVAVQPDILAARRRAKPDAQPEPEPEVLFDPDDRAFELEHRLRLGTKR